MKTKYYQPTFLYNKITRYSFLFFLLPGLYACPYSSPYKLDDQPIVQTEDIFIGKWATMVVNGAGNMEPLKMILTKNGDYEYDINFTGNINDLRYYNVVKDDTIKGTAFLSEVASRKILNIQIKGQNYISEIVFKDDKISLLPLCEHFTVKIIKSNAALREALELHYKTRLYPLYDDPFCLREMVRVN